MKVISKPKLIGKKHTVDIEVQNTHSYQLQNGIVSHNTISLLGGVSAGIHYPHSGYYIRRVRLNKQSEYVSLLKNLGYFIQDDVYNPLNTVVIQFPIKTTNYIKGKKQTTLFQQMMNASDMQRYWADNSVSVTVTFKPNQEKDLQNVLQIFQDKLKCVSFLKQDTTAYKQLPYQQITKQKYEQMKSKITGNIGNFNVKSQGVGQRFCNNDSCTI